MGADITKISFQRKIYNKFLEKIRTTKTYKVYRYQLLHNKFLKKYNEFFDFFIKIRLQSGIYSNKNFLIF